jgi:hypothetical protein
VFLMAQDRDASARFLTPENGDRGIEYGRRPNQILPPRPQDRIAQEVALHNRARNFLLLPVD